MGKRGPVCRPVWRALAMLGVALIPGVGYAGDAVLEPFDVLFQRDPAAIATAAPVTVDPAADPLTYPTLLPALSRAEAQAWGLYDDQFRLGQGNYAGSHAHASAAGGRVVAPAETPVGRLGLGVEYRYADATLRVERANAEGVSVRRDDFAASVRAAAAFAPTRWLAIGVGNEDVPAGRRRSAVWTEARARLARTGTTVTYRNAEEGFALDLALRSNDATLRLPLDYSDHVDEVQVIQPLPGGWNLSAAGDLSNTSIWSWEAARKGGRLDLRAGSAARPFRYVVRAEADDGSEGDATVRLALRSAFGAVRWRTAGGKHITAAVRRGRLAGGGTGTLEAGSFLSTLDRLLFGRRVFEYDAAITLRQYQVGITGPEKGRWGWGTGLQVLHVVPRARLTHWTPPPVIPIGRLDEQTETLEIEEAWLVAVGAGVSLQTTKGTWMVALAQSVPALTREADGGGGTSGGGTAGGNAGANRGGTRLMFAWRRPF